MLDLVDAGGGGRCREGGPEEFKSRFRTLDYLEQPSGKFKSVLFAGKDDTRSISSGLSTSVFEKHNCKAASR